ncbi:hypothetical protein WBG06_09965 [Nocardioides sp. CCNWLW239]|uniref:hypothetical protein n=1 Tax=Nocardioides sp. CCNWLW239 TaxID=3128902 RepID=UPI003018058B
MTAAIGVTNRATETYNPWLALETPALRPAVEAGDWGLTARILGGLDVERCSKAVGLIAETDGVEAWLIPAANGGDLMARTVLGARFVRIAWLRRSGYRAPYVSAAQFAGFFEALSAAEELLTSVTAVAPTYVHAWEWRILTALGLELGIVEARRRYDHIAALVPHHFAAQQTFLQHLLPKWFGSWELAEAFADECRGVAPLGSPSRALWATVEVERWLDIPSHRPQTHPLGHIAAETVSHPAHRPGPWGAAVHAELAFLYSRAGQPRSAAVHFAALDVRPSRNGWAYHDRTEAIYRKGRRRALGRGFVGRFGSS